MLSNNVKWASTICKTVSESLGIDFKLYFLWMSTFVHTHTNLRILLLYLICMEKRI
jgi:hypothetical protein